VVFDACNYERLGGESFPFTEARAAYEYVQSGSHFGADVANGY